MSLHVYTNEVVMHTLVSGVTFWSTSSFLQLHCLMTIISSLHCIKVTPSGLGKLNHPIYCLWYTFISQYSTGSSGRCWTHHHLSLSASGTCVLGEKDDLKPGGSCLCIYTQCRCVFVCYLRWSKLVCLI